MQKLNISFENPNDKPDTTIVYFEGDFDGYAKEDIATIQNFIDNCKQNSVLVFDFSKLNYLNSYAIGHLVSWHNHISKIEGRILIAGVHKNVEDIFAVLGITSLFKIYDDTNEALKDIQ